MSTKLGEPEKLREMSVSISIIQYWAMKATSEVLRKSLSGVIRESVHDLLEFEVWGEGAVYRHLLVRAGCFVRKSQRDTDELCDGMGSRMGRIDRDLQDAITDRADELAKESIDPLNGCELIPEKLIPEKLTTTINVCISPAVVRTIRSLVNIKLYKTQSEFLRRAISDYLNRRVWSGVVPLFGEFHSRDKDCRQAWLEEAVDE